MNKKRQLTISLRKEGKTYGEISDIIKIPKSTVAWRLKNIKLSESLQKKILGRCRKKWKKNITAYNRLYGKIRSQRAAEIRENYKQKAVKGIKNNKIKAKIHIYPGMNYQKTLNFWARTTKLPKINFYKPQIQISRASKRKRLKNSLPHGTLHITAGDTKITSIVTGWIEGISKKISAGLV